MKKTLISLLIFTFTFSVIGFAKAEEVNTDTITTNNVANEATLTSEIITPEAVTTSAITTGDTNVTTVTTNDSNTKLEKISHPDQIKLYERIKKIGNALWGYKKQGIEKIKKEAEKIKKEAEKIKEKTKEAIKKNEIKKEIKKDQINSTEQSNNKLEKISHPDQINLYEKIKKIGNALWGYRKVNSSLKFAVTPEMITCLSQAIDKKDQAIITALNVYKEDLATVITKRGTCQKESLGKTEQNEKVKGLNNCVAAYQTEANKIFTKSKEARTTAWEQYKKDLQNCKVPTVISNTTETSTTETINNTMPKAPENTSEPIIIEDGGNQDNLQL
ncbi:MAG: hypothetical protein MUF50_03285 [Planctomycetes bacterium]|jgi:hypothetical protein|nr:hypothetical protein [Planctomycetota bacterium]